MFSVIFIIIGAYIGVTYKQIAFFSFTWIWLISTMWMNADSGRFNTIYSLRESGYPNDHCITPRRMKFLFAYRSDVEGGNDIPKEIVQMNVFGFFNLIISGIVLLCSREKFDGAISGIYAEIDTVIVFIVMITLMVKAEKIAFKNRYKKLNRYNWKYFMNGFKLNQTPAELGKCRIISINRKRGDKYVTVEILSSGKILENILFCGKLNIRETYMLYEICRLKYVDHVPLQNVHTPIQNCIIIGGKTIRQHE